MSKENRAGGARLRWHTLPLKFPVQYPLFHDNLSAVKNVAPLTILYSDNHLLVIDKPAGIATMGTDEGTPTIARQAALYVQQTYHKPGKAFIGIVSRIDRLVSGVLVLARTSKAASRLSEQLRQQQWGKSYLAIVEGHWPVLGPTACATPQLDSAAPSSAGNWLELVDYVAKDEAAQCMRVVDRIHHRGQLARLRVRALATVGQQSLLQVELLTGRKHQIRLQLSQHGTPIWGDVKYGARRQAGDGIGLHCQQLTLIHPTLKDTRVFRASAGTHWRKAWGQLPPQFSPWLDA